ncbi:MAG: hypothetical protein H7836_13140 [Magnetococcus sp. YQC-3]
MMYDKINIYEYKNNLFLKIGSEDSITEVSFRTNENVRLYLSDRLVELIKNNSFYKFKDILYGQEIEYTSTLKQIKNPFKD